jgi:serine acetyltransferase
LEYGILGGFMRRLGYYFCSTAIAEPVVIILKGVTIGDDSVVGAGCVVTKDISAGGIAVGNPMKIIGSVYAD